MQNMKDVSTPYITDGEAYELAKPDYDWLYLSNILKRVNYKKPKYISYSRNVTIPVTTRCRNRCGYCGYIRPDSEERQAVVPLKEVRRILEQGSLLGCKEMLLVSGEQPEEAHPEVRTLLHSWGFKDLVDYLVCLCEIALEMGLLPHTNAGLLCRKDLQRLSQVNASMGLMLESASDRLCSKGGPHEFSPGKAPAERIKFIEEAGRLGIPFTSGILVGIGETAEERVSTLLLLREIHYRYEHIQEIIIQNFCPKDETPMADYPAPAQEEMLKTVALARLIFGPAINIQIAPNLSPQSYQNFVSVGVNDWGGISPLTGDEINPEKPWPSVAELQSRTADTGSILRERLPVYPSYISKAAVYPRLSKVISSLVNEDGYAKIYQPRYQSMKEGCL